MGLLPSDEKEGHYAKEVDVSFFHKDSFPFACIGPITLCFLPTKLNGGGLQKVTHSLTHLLAIFPVFLPRSLYCIALHLFYRTLGVAAMPSCNS